MFIHDRPLAAVLAALAVAAATVGLDRACSAGAAPPPPAPPGPPPARLCVAAALR
jgi:hypothetical protein